MRRGHRPGDQHLAQALHGSARATTKPRAYDPAITRSLSHSRDSRAPRSTESPCGAGKWCAPTPGCKPAGANQTVVITAEAALIETESPTIGSTLDNRDDHRTAARQPRYLLVPLSESEHRAGRRRRSLQVSRRADLRRQLFARRPAFERRRLRRTDGQPALARSGRRVDCAVE